MHSCAEDQADISHTGLTSIVPWPAPGQRFAQAIAASRQFGGEMTRAMGLLEHALTVAFRRVWETFHELR